MSEPKTHGQELADLFTLGSGDSTRSAALVADISAGKLRLPPCWIIDTAEETIPLSMLEEAGPDEEIDEALTDACTERDMLAARLKEVEAERDALKAAAERQEAEIAKLEGRLRRFEGPGFAGGDVS